MERESSLEKMSAHDFHAVIASGIKIKTIANPANEASTISRI